MARKPIGERAMTSAQRVRRHRARLKTNASPLPIPSVAAADHPPPGDDFAERQGAITTCDELIEEFKTVAANLMPPAPEGEDAKARLWFRLGLERATGIVERHRAEIKDIVR